MTGENKTSEQPALSTTAEDAAEVWRGFCKRLEGLGDVLTRPETPNSDRIFAEGMRYFTHMLRYGLIMHLEASDPDFPFFFPMTDDITDFTGPNLDNVYWTAIVSGDRDYRITGNRGTTFFFSLGAKAWQTSGASAGMKSSGEVGDNNMVFEADGSFEIIASPTPKPGNWLRMDPETNYLLLRQTLLDRTVERPGHFHIERIGAPASPKPWNVATIAAGLEKVTSYIEGTATTFANIAKLLMNQPNRFTDFGPDFFKNSGGDPRLTYMVGYFTIAVDEAWVIDFVPPRAPYWNFSIYSHWNQTFDARYRKVGVNNHNAKLNDDGSMTIVVASRDVGLGNWLDTDGHIEGQGVFRGLDSQDVPTMTFRVVKLAELQATRGDRSPA